MVQDITVSDALLSDPDVGIGTFTATATFDTPMEGEPPCRSEMSAFNRPHTTTPQTLSFRSSPHTINLLK